MLNQRRSSLTVSTRSFYCRPHWDIRCDKEEGRLMHQAMHAPLTEEEKAEFGIEEAE